MNITGTGSTAVFSSSIAHSRSARVNVSASSVQVVGIDDEDVASTHVGR